MDPVTHTLVGAALSRGGLRRRTPLATATLLIGVNLPDVDALSHLASADVALGFRRGWTHGILAIALMPLALAAAMVLYDRLWRRPHGATPVRPAQLLLLSYLAVATHPFLDWLNTYGIRLLMPFDSRWFYGDMLFIVDPWLWLVLGGGAFLTSPQSLRLGIAWGVLGGLTTLVVLAGAPSITLKALWVAGLAVLIALRRGPLAAPNERNAARLAQAALAAAGLYVALLFTGSAVAGREIRSVLESRGIGPVEDLMIGPLPARVLSRDVLVVTPEGYRFGTFDWLARPRLSLDDRALPHPGQPNAGTTGTPASELVEAALAAPCLRGMARWMRYPVAEIEESGDGWDVYFLDARYARGRGKGFGTHRVRLGQDLEPACGQK